MSNSLFIIAEVSQSVGDVDIAGCKGCRSCHAEAVF
ncbi:hypothetical protein PSBY109024_18855 [Pseudoalteromonas byunsanensis]